MAFSFIESKFYKSLLFQYVLHSYIRVAYDFCIKFSTTCGPLPNDHVGSRLLYFNTLHISQFKESSYLYFWSKSGYFLTSTNFSTLHFSHFTSPQPKYAGLDFGMGRALFFTSIFNSSPRTPRESQPSKHTTSQRTWFQRHVLTLQPVQNHYLAIEFTSSAEMTCSRIVDMD